MVLSLLLIALAQREPPGQISLQPCGPDGPIYCSSGGVSPPAFEFANTSGVGMGAACACTNPTGTKGETLTFTRASSATCLKGNLTTGIANGDMVTCSSNQPLIQPRPDTGTGQLGWQYEPAGTNTFLQGDAIDNAAWTKLGSGDGSTPTVTADQAVAPSGATTADRVDFSSCTTGRSVVYQIASFSGTGVASTFARAVGTSCSIAVCGATGACSRQTMTSSSWTRLASPSGPYVSGGTTPFIGNACADEGAAAAACSVYIAAAQSEASSYATSYIATTTAAATRQDGTFSIAQSVLTTAGVTNANGCGGADLYFSPLATTTLFNCGLGGGDSAGRIAFSVNSPPIQIRSFDGANQNSSSTVASISGALTSVAARWQTGVGLNSYSPVIGGDGVLQPTYNNNMFGSGIVSIGHASAGCLSNDSFWLSRLRFDTYAKGCH